MIMGFHNFFYRFICLQISIRFFTTISTFIQQQFSSQSSRLKIYSKMENTCADGDDDDDLPLILLSEDVLIHILVWLPVRSLLRFKSVCKSWRALIESSFFTNLHAITFNSSSEFGTFIFQTTKYYCSPESEIFMLSSRFDDGDGDGDGDDIDDKYYKPDDKVRLFRSFYHKFFGSSNKSGIVGSCNGLVCLHDSKLRDVSLWNPATRQFRLLPKSLTLEEGIGNFVEDFVAFGFDVKTKDYKVVQVTHFRPYKKQYPLAYIYRVQVYSLSTDSWRLLEGINSLSALPVQGIIMVAALYLNGKCYFRGMPFGGKDDLILSFDFTKEIFTSIQFPDHERGSWLSLSYFGEKLAVFTRLDSSSGGDRYEDYDIWVLNENKESWTKLHSSFRIKQREKRKGIACDETRPIVISNDGKFAFLKTRSNGHDYLQLFNLVTKQTELDFTVTNVVRADVYKQSLVSITRGNGGGAAITTAADRVIGGGGGM